MSNALKYTGYVVFLVGAIAVAKATLFKPREVLVGTAAEQQVIAEVQGTGTVTTKVMAKIGSKISGRVERVLVDEGDSVKAGQVIAELEDTDLERQVDRARARLEMARASEWEAKRTWARAKRLLPSGAMAQEEVDIAEERFRVAASAIHVEEAELRFHEFKLSEAQVPTLVSGVVTRRWVEPGDAVVSGQPVMSVADTSIIWVEADVDQRFAGNVRKGQAATVILRGRPEQPFRGEVSRVNPQADPVTEEMLVEVSFALPPAEFQEGQWAEVYIEVDLIENALVVPKAALMPIGNDRFVFVADALGRVQRVKVQPLTTSPRLPVIAVTGDLRVGDEVILNPIGLSGGETVRVARTPGESPGIR